MLKHWVSSGYLDAVGPLRECDRVPRCRLRHVWVTRLSEGPHPCLRHEWGTRHPAPSTRQRQCRSFDCALCAPLRIQTWGR
jgi:hypothetical protein